MKKRFNIKEWQKKHLHECGNNCDCNCNQNINEAFVASDMKGWIKDTENFTKKLEAYLKAVDQYTESGKVKNIRATDGLRISLQKTIDILSYLPGVLNKFGKAEK